MKRKLLLSALLTIFVLATGACQNNTKNKETIANMVNLDSLLASYQATPLYYINYGNEGCLFELRVNDVLVDELTQAGTIGGTSAIINPYILKSGKQKISIKLYPNPGSKMIYSTNPYPYYKPFQLEVCMVDDKLEPGKREVVTVYKMPDIVTPKEGMPYYEFETEFEAQVPYQIEGWSNCIDLREVSDIEKRVVAEFERVRQLMIDHKFDELKQYYANKNNELGITSYESNEGCEERWNNTVKKISKANLDDWQAIEDYKLIFEADGRSVTLRSKKKKGIPSALVWIKEKEGESEWSGSYFELHLGIKKGTDKFVALP